MSGNISSRVRLLRPTAVNAILAEVRAAQAEGKKLVSLMRGEPDFRTPPHIVEAAEQALRNGRTTYPDNRGEMPLREAVAEKLHRENGLTYKPADQILVTTGATFGIYAALMALLEPGDEVLLPEPIYDAYHSPIALAGGVARTVPCTIEQGRFALSPDAVEAACGPRTQVLLLNTPWNPTGTVFTREELTALTTVIENRNLFLLSDEIYEAITYPPHTHISPAGFAPHRSILINSFSKTYAMTGWRVGYCAGPAEIIQAMFLILQQSSRGPATFVQDAAVVALGGSQACVAEMRQEYTRRRTMVHEALDGVNGCRILDPEGGFFSMADLRAHAIPSEEIRRRLMRDHGVVVVHGSAYGAAGEGTLRVSFASGGETLERGLHQLREGLAASMSIIPLESLTPPVPHAQVGEVDRQKFEQALHNELEGEVRFDKVSRALYSTDASVYQIDPVGVVIPAHEQDLIRAVSICNTFQCPLTIRGGGTSQAGQAIGEGLQIDISKHLNRVLELNVEERWVRVEPGIVLDELNAELKVHGLRFAPDITTASRATIGGMMANNSSGARSVLYGKTGDHVLEQRVLLADGSIVMCKPVRGDELEAKLQLRTLEGDCYRVVKMLAAEHAVEIGERYPKVMRRVGGYNLDAFTNPDQPFDLTKLIVGSEGTLAVILDAKLKLVPLPKHKAVLAVEFTDVLEALGATPVILNHGPSAVEVMDKFILDHTKDSPSLDRIRRGVLQGDPGALLCVEFYADAVEDLRPRMQAAESDLHAHGFTITCSYAMDVPSQARIWSLREAALGLSTAMKGDAKSVSFVEDTAVAPEKLRAYIDRFLGIIKKHETQAGIYAHASVGCLHVRPVVNLKTEAGVKKFEAIAHDVANLVLEFGGALSGEHGDGYVRSPFMSQMFGPRIYEAFRLIKRTFDPFGILNPGKIVDAPPLTENLRFGVNYRTTSPQTFFEYPGHQDFAGAVEMCSGVGACRKKLEGTMCPSYMATKDEMHSTRGRANILRMAMSGRLGEAGLGEAGIKEVLDLCLECRACKTECPVGVDVGRFKSEFLADHHRRNGISIEARMLGHVHGLAVWGSVLAPFSNWIAGSAPVRFLNEALFGIDARRKLPLWASKPLRARISVQPSEQAFLFTDTFTNYYEPRIGEAALRVLAAAGVSCNLAPNVCCGRPLISQGLLKEAQELALRNANILFPIAQQDKPILFCEPSCLSAIKEDAPALLRGEAREKALAVAARSFLWEEWVEAECGEKLKLKSGPEEILLHGHCHQKSMGLLAASKALLSRIPGAKVIDLDAGCCGMAGSFGYLKRRYEVSQAIGERKLLPAARALKASQSLVAAGISCRHQMADLANARTSHPAVLIAELLQS